MIVAVVVAPTAEVLTVKFAEVEPPAAVTVAGKVTAPSPVERSTTMPSAGAAAVRITVPSAVCPPVTLDGLMLTALSAVAVCAGVLL